MYQSFYKWVMGYICLCFVSYLFLRQGFCTAVPVTCYVDQARSELRYLPPSDSHVPRLKVCTTMSCYKVNFFIEFLEFSKHSH